MRYRAAIASVAALGLMAAGGVARSRPAEDADEDAETSLRGEPAADREQRRQALVERARSPRYVRKVPTTEADHEAVRQAELRNARKAAFRMKQATGATPQSETSK